jgi:hypothetical protein
LKKRLLAIALAVASGAAVIAALSVGATASTTTTGPTTTQPERVTVAEATGIALQVAAVCGEPNPKIETAETTLEQAVSLSGAPAPEPTITDPRTGKSFADSPVILVAMTGHFTGADAPVPSGSKPITGTTMDLAIDAVSGSVIVEYVGNAPTPDLSTSGNSAAGSADMRYAQAAPASETAKVVGHIFGEGLGSTRATPLTQTSVRINVVAHKHVVATTTTKNGGFFFRLHPGTYRLEAYVGKGTSCDKEEVTVPRNAHVITVRLTCVAR